MIVALHRSGSLVCCKWTDSAQAPLHSTHGRCQPSCSLAVRRYAPLRQAGCPEEGKHGHQAAPAKVSPSQPAAQGKCRAKWLNREASIRPLYCCRLWDAQMGRPKAAHFLPSTPFCMMHQCTRGHPCHHPGDWPAPPLPAPHLPVVQQLEGCGSGHAHHGRQALTQLCRIRSNALVWVVHCGCSGGWPWLLLLIRSFAGSRLRPLLLMCACRLLLRPSLPQLQKVVGVLALAVAAVQVARQPLAPRQRQPLCGAAHGGWETEGGDGHGSMLQSAHALGGHQQG